MTPPPRVYSTIISVLEASKPLQRRGGGSHTAFSCLPLGQLPVSSDLPQLECKKPSLMPFHTCSAAWPRRAPHTLLGKAGAAGSHTEGQGEAREAWKHFLVFNTAACKASCCLAEEQRVNIRDPPQGNPACPSSHLTGKSLPNGLPHKLHYERVTRNSPAEVGPLANSMPNANLQGLLRSRLPWDNCRSRREGHQDVLPALPCSVPAAPSSCMPLESRGCTPGAAREACSRRKQALWPGKAQLPHLTLFR